MEKLKKTIYKKDGTSLHPVLVAVDEWNAKFEESKSCPELLEFFALQKLRSGFWLYAVSSSFGPTSGFQNADKQTLSVDIPWYNKEELMPS
ncbi:hypothetical protein BGX21_004813 [Mortierella sp. AD011]|nr:hypothetical protein BGX21_004813 [Mortierella sp. AD011]